MSTLDKEIEIIMLKGETGGTIDRLEKTATVGNVDTYTIFMTDGSTYTFNVTNGTSISTIEKTATVGKVDTYTITLTDGSTTTFQVTNGEVTLEQFRVFESELEDFCDDFEQQIDVIDNDINNQSTGLKARVSNVETYKVDKEFNTDNNTQKITNDENGLEITNEDTSSDDYPNSKIKVESGIITLQSESYNNGADDDTYITKVLILDEDILIKRDLGNGEETYSLLTLARRHLYRHDIKLTKSSGGAYNVVFTLYLSTATQLTTTTEITNIIGTRFSLNAGGYYLDSSSTQVGGVNYIYGLGTAGEINVNYSRIVNGGLDTYNGGFTASDVVNDTVTQIF